MILKDSFTSILVLNKQFFEQSKHYFQDFQTYRTKKSLDLGRSGTDSLYFKKSEDISFLMKIHICFLSYSYCWYLAGQNFRDLFALHVSLIFYQISKTQF
jgi:hypothetical protein